MPAWWRHSSLTHILETPLKQNSGGQSKKESGDIQGQNRENLLTLNCRSRETPPPAPGWFQSVTPPPHDGERVQLSCLSLSAVGVCCDGPESHHLSKANLVAKLYRNRYPPPHCSTPAMRGGPQIQCYLLLLSTKLILSLNLGTKKQND